MLLFEVITSQESFETAVQTHPACVVTLTVPAPPAEANDWLDGEAAYVHGTGALKTTSAEKLLSSPTWS